MRDYFTNVAKHFKQDSYDFLYYKKGKKINTIGWWTKNEKEVLNFPLCRFLLSYKGILTSIPNIDLISVFEKREEVEKKLRKNSVKIFYTGEDCNINYPDFKDYLIYKTDLSIGFDYEEDVPKCNNYIRIGLGALRFFHLKLSKDVIKKDIDRINLQPNNYAGDFASLVARHDSMGDKGKRKILMDIVSKVGHVSCAGKLFHNDDRLIVDFNNNKHEYLKQFMFCICPENVNVKGYVTEKIYDAFSSGCIPVYSGGGGLS